MIQVHSQYIDKESRDWRFFGVPLVVLIFFASMMLPTSASLNLGGLRLSPFRIVLIIMFAPMLYMLMTGKRGKLNVFDALVLGHAVWAMLALVNWGGLKQGLESGGIYTIEFAGAYLLGRLYIRSLEDFEAFAQAYVAVVVGLLIFTIPEALSAVHFLHDTFASLFGGPRAHHIDPRMGLERAFGPFDHPILYGVFSASAFSMAYFVVAQRRLLNIKQMLKVFGVLVATFVSASGGPYTVLIMQVLLIGWERIFEGLSGRWTALFSIFGVAYFAIDIFSNRTPFHVFVTYLTFSAQSAYNRINIWIYGTAEVYRNPLLGIGLGDWIRAPWMSDSMDNFWLLTAVRYGLPALIMLLILLIGLIYAVAQVKAVSKKWVNARHAWAFTLFGITVAAATVHLWNSMFVLFMFLIGSGVWFYDSDSRLQPKNYKRHPKICSPQRKTLF